MSRRYLGLGRDQGQTKHRREGMVENTPESWGCQQVTCPWQEHWLNQLHRDRVIAVVRVPQLALGVTLAQALAAGGIRQIEVTWNSDRPTQLLQQLTTQLPDCVIGAGTILTPAMAAAAIAAGAQFLFSPHLEPGLIQAATGAQIPIVPGAFSPTEIVTAWQAGATAVKVFPMQTLGGDAYVRALQGPLGHIPLIPTGGVTRANTPDLLQAGAIAVGLSTDLMPKAAIAQQNWDEITRRSRQLVTQIQALNQ